MTANTDRAESRLSSGWDPPSNSTHPFGEPREISEDPLPKFLSERHDYPLDRTCGRKRSRVLKSALIIAFLASAFAALLTMFEFDDLRILANKANEAVDSVTSDIRAAVTARNPISANRSPQIVKDYAYATVGAASRSGTPVEDRALPAPPVNSMRIPPVSSTREEPPPKSLDDETLSSFIARAKKMLASGDVVAARLLLERAASAQSASAAFLLARTYDPAVLSVRDSRSVAPDNELARRWYSKAARLGSEEAQRRLSQLQN